MHTDTLYCLTTICIDIAIIVLLVFLIIKSSRNQSLFKKSDMCKMNLIENSLKKMMDESLKQSNDFMLHLENKTTELSELLDRAKVKEINIQRCLDAADVAMEKSTKYRYHNAAGVDTYQKAADLISQGVTSLDIQKACGISNNEIELIKQILLYKAH